MPTLRAKSPLKKTQNFFADLREEGENTQSSYDEDEEDHYEDDEDHDEDDTPDEYKDFEDPNQDLLDACEEEMAGNVDDPGPMDEEVLAMWGDASIIRRHIRPDDPTSLTVLESVTLIVAQAYAHHEERVTSDLNPDS